MYLTSYARKMRLSDVLIEYKDVFCTHHATLYRRGDTNIHRIRSRVRGSQFHFNNIIEMKFSLRFVIISYISIFYGMPIADYTRALGSATNDDMYYNERCSLGCIAKTRFLKSKDCTTIGGEVKKNLLE
jgi:hypothetical protein